MTAPTVDNATASTASTSGGSTTSIATSHDAGSDTDHALLVGIAIITGSTRSASITGITFNGAGMTMIPGTQIEQDPGAGSYKAVETSWWYLSNPTNGVNDLVASFSEGIGAAYFRAYNVTGQDTADPYGGVGIASGEADDITTPITTEGTDSVVMFVGCIHGSNVSSTPFTPNSGTTEDDQGETGPDDGFDLNYFFGRKSAPTAGGYTIGAVLPASDDWTGSAVEIKSTGGGGVSSSIKTILGLAVASVKTVNGLAIASVKTKNGLA